MKELNGKRIHAAYNPIGLAAGFASIIIIVKIIVIIVINVIVIITLSSSS